MKRHLILIFLLSVLISNISAQKLSSGDGVRITFLDITDQILDDYFIQQDGNIQLPFLGIVKTTNVDYRILKQTIFKKYSKLYKDPASTIQPLIRINIMGEVRTMETFILYQVTNA